MALVFIFGTAQKKSYYIRSEYVVLIRQVKKLVSSVVRIANSSSDFAKLNFWLLIFIASTIFMFYIVAYL